MGTRLAQLRVLDRTSGPATSNSCIFQVPGLQGVQFCAYAVTGGTIVVKVRPC